MLGLAYPWVGDRRAVLGNLDARGVDRRTRRASVAAMAQLAITSFAVVRLGQQRVGVFCRHAVRLAGFSEFRRRNEMVALARTQPHLGEPGGSARAVLLSEGTFGKWDGARAPRRGVDGGDLRAVSASLAGWVVVDVYNSFVHC